MATYLKNSSPFIYDTTTNGIVGVRSEVANHFFLGGQYEPAYYKNAPNLTITAPAATFATLTYDDNGGLVRLSSAGIHSLTASAVGRYVYVSWAGGTGVNGFYAITNRSVTTQLTINLPYVAGLGTPTVSVVLADIPLVTQTIPAGTMNIGMTMEFDALFGCSGTTNAKTMKANIGTAAWYSQSIASSFQSLCVEKKACVFSSADIISNALAAPGHGTASGANVTMSPAGGISAAQDFTIFGSISTADEFITLVAWTLKINGA